MDRRGFASRSSSAIRGQGGLGYQWLDHWRVHRVGWRMRGVRCSDQQQTPEHDELADAHNDD
jgi:hypothetical protein